MLYGILNDLDSIHILDAIDFFGEAAAAAAHLLPSSPPTPLCLVVSLSSPYPSLISPPPLVLM